MAKKYIVKVKDEDGNEEEIEIPEKIHRAMAGVARAEIEKYAAEQRAKDDDDDGGDSWWSLGGEDD